MQLRFFTLFLICAAVPVTGQVVVTTTGDPHIARYGLGKTQSYEQTGPGTPTISSFDFNVFIDTTTGGVINAATVYGPTNSYLDSGQSGPQDLILHSGGAEFKASRDVALLDTDFPNDAVLTDSNGNYRLAIDVGSLGGPLNDGFDYVVKFKLAGSGGSNAYPDDIPQLTVLGNGAWEGGAYVVAATGEETVFGWSFSDFDQQNANDYVTIFAIRPSAGGDDVIRWQVQGSNPGGYTLAADQLIAGVAYTGTLTFAHIVYRDSDTVPGVTGVAYYAVETSFALQAVPEPSTYALLGLGLGTALLWTRRRRITSTRG